MYIKQVVIEGFKSYREQVATETFSPKVNCVVGANGSGKSNFFHAIRFVISDLFHNLRNEERQALLHEGAGHQVLSAFVEIVFDNSDNRIPLLAHGAKGFWRARAFFEGRCKSGQKKAIIQVVQYLDDKLRELDEEKEELKKYQQLDRQRKSLEYTIYDKELHHAKQMLMDEKKLRDEIEQLKKDIREQDAYIKNRKDEAAELESLISGYRQGYSQYKAERDKLHDERKVLWARENELSAEIERLKSEVVKAEKSLDHATPGDIRRGLNSVKRICKEINLHEGVFGPIFELLDCDEKFFTAVEVTAGNSLFHVVVETDEISTKIIRHLNAQKGGRVTFIPLNRVKAPRVTYPQSSDVIPLLKKLQFSDKYASAFAQVFAKTVICRDLDVATRVARTDGLDCITLEGDQVNKKGGMTGGFYDYRRSKLKFMSTIKQNMKSIKIKEEELEEIDQKINELVAEQQKNDAKLAHEKSLLEQLRQDAMNSEKQKQSISKSLEKKEKLLSSVLTQIDQNRANIAMKQDEMGTELVDHLTPGRERISFSAESGNN
ncbi:UNVERIFIED_CONTAM: Structural maintenance of chromosomes protein 3 [Sesamum latifolium]|uniref:Structural maintenance of chromosomes protein 3 n=1 Tax=Sesamum latifolium TaxID=2727402 RepID=A0AAW2Y4Y5_9LAMI